MDEFYRELQEDLQRERLANLWKRYGGTLIGISLAIVLGTSAGVFWRHHEKSEAMEQTGALVSALESKEQDAAKTLDQLMAVAAGQEHGAAAIAGLQRAALLSTEGKFTEAATAYQQIADTATLEPGLRALARILSVQAHLKAGDAAAATATERKAGDAFYFTHTELAGWAALEAGKPGEAGALFAEVRDAVNAPPGLQERAALVAASLPQSPPAKE